MSLEMDPAAPVAGQLVTFTATASISSGRPCCALGMVPGDSGEAWQPFSPNSETCALPTLPSSAQDAITYTFNHSGRTEFSYSAGSLCDGLGSDPAIGQILGVVDVGAGVSTAQGPSLPVLTVDDARLPSQMQDPSFAAIVATGSHADGYIAGFTLNWGDASPTETFPGDGNACVQNAEGWPRSQALLLAPNTVNPATHTYTTGGPHTITVTVTSTACDGSDPQTTTTLFAWPPSS